MADELSRIVAALSDRYTIDREVGRGGMATVYLAEDVKHRRTVAIKVLHPDIAASLGRERFLREIEIVANLRHRGILPLYDSGEADGLLYYVMPYVEGPTLRDRLEKEKQLAVEEALRITSELAAALDEAHSHGVIHRDIKPENVLFEGDQPLIADFGVATALEEAGGEKLTRTGVAVGTPSYMSPEQAAGGQADARSDEYALACVLYEMLGGTPPFTGPTPQAVMARHALDPVPDLGTVRSTVPEGVIGAVEKAMSKVPADRYASAGAFAEALARGEGRRRSRGGHPPALVYVVASLVLVVVAGLYLRSALRSSADASTRRLAVLPFDVVGADLPDTGLAVGLFADVSDRLRGSGVETIWPDALYRYRDSDSPVDAVREDLDPDVIWVTRLSTSGDSVLVRAELVDARSMVTLEATTLSAPVAALITVVPRLTAWASRVLRLEEVQPGYEPDQEARRAYIRARTAWWDFDIELTDSLIAEALRLDPDYPEAWGLYALLELQLTHGDWAPPCSMYAAQLPVVKQAAQRALEMDSSLIMPRVAMGHALWEHEFDWSGAETAFLEALERDPDHPDANLFYGVYLMTAGKPERAWHYVYRAAQANILEPRFQSWAAMLASWTGNLVEAEQMLRVARTRLGADSWATGSLINNLRNQGRLDEAIQLLVEAGRDTIAEPLDDEAAWAVARGNREAVDRRIAANVDEGYRLHPARIAYWDGRFDLAMQFLEEWWPGQLECPSRGRVWLLADFPDLIGRPRFQEMMDAAGIPWRESEIWAEMSGS